MRALGENSHAPNWTRSSPISSTHLQRAYRRQFVAVSGRRACLDACEAAGWRLAVCTNKLEYSSKLLLEKLGVADRFAFVCGQDTFGVAKPDPRPLVETIRSAGGESTARSWSAIP